MLTSLGLLVVLLPSFFCQTTESTSRTSGGYKTLGDQRVSYHHRVGNLTAGALSKQVDCHIFSTLYTQQDSITLLGFLMPNEGRSLGGFPPVFLVKPEEVEFWDPQLRVTMQDDTSYDIPTTKWLLWPEDPELQIRAAPLTFNITMNKTGQLSMLQIADWDPMPVLTSGEYHQADVGQDGVIMVYSHVSGRITTAIASVLHHHVTYHMQLGVDEFWLYASSQQIADLHLSHALKPVIESGQLKLILWLDGACEHYLDCIDTNDHLYKHQVLVYNAARLAGVHTGKALLIMDADEYLVLNRAAIGNSVSCLVQHALQSHAQISFTRYDSFTCQIWQSVGAVPDIHLLEQDPAIFLSHFTNRSKEPYRPNKGKSIVSPKQIALYMIHGGVGADQYTTRWQPSTTAFIMHLVNLWHVRECSDAVEVERLPAWTATNLSTDSIFCNDKTVPY